MAADAINILGLTLAYGANHQLRSLKSDERRLLIKQDATPEMWGLFVKQSARIVLGLGGVAADHTKRLAKDERKAIYRDSPILNTRDRGDLFGNRAPSLSLLLHRLKHMADSEKKRVHGGQMNLIQVTRKGGATGQAGGALFARAPPGYSPNLIGGTGMSRTSLIRCPQQAPSGRQLLSFLVVG